MSAMPWCRLASRTRPTPGSRISGYDEVQMFSAAILIGGKATRFEGRDKSALLVDGETILSRQLAAVADVVSDVMLVGSSRRYQTQMPVHYVDDIVPGCGPLSGLH